MSDPVPVEDLFTLTLEIIINNTDSLASAIEEAFEKPTLNSHFVQYH
jgi:hypothetical protein